MGSNLIPTVLVGGEKYRFFSSDHYKFIENNRIRERLLLVSTNDSLYPFDYHLAKCGGSAIKTLKCNQILSFTRMKKLKNMMKRKIYGELRENWMIGLKKKGI